jgi:hypothetical protein
MFASFNTKFFWIYRFSGPWLTIAGVLMFGLAPDSRLSASVVTDDPVVTTSTSTGSSPEIEIGPAAEVEEDSQMIVDAPPPALPPESHTLSVEPSSQLLPKDRPAWIGSEPDLESSTHQFVVQSIPTSLKDEVESNLDAPLEESMQGYLNSMLGDNRAGELLRDRIDASFIRRNLLEEAKSYVAELQTAVGPVYQKWVMVEISPKQREQFRLWYNQHQQRQRLAPLGLAIAGLISLVGMSHLVLRRRCGRLADTALPPFNADAMGNPPGTNKFQSKCRWKGNIAALLAIGIAVIIATSTSTIKSSSKSKKTDRKNSAVITSETTGKEVTSRSKKTTKQRN